MQVLVYIYSEFLIQRHSVYYAYDSWNSDVLLNILTIGCQGPETVGSIAKWSKTKDSIYMKITFFSEYSVVFFYNLNSGICW